MCSSEDGEGVNFRKGLGMSEEHLLNVAASVGLETADRESVLQFARLGQMVNV